MNNLKPFKKFCLYIGTLPSAYVECMSYYEALTYVIKYLEKEVIPTVNNNSDVVKELQEYVAHYFDNLDVQEEINNKLDEMAEGGQLVEIIGEYLNSKAITGYNVIDDMVEATNLIDGSITKTLGKDSADDGYGAFYKIREKEEADDPDGYYLVELDNENLVAEMIPNSNNGLIKDSVDENTNNIENLKNITKINDKLFLGVFFNDQDSNKIYFKISRDGKHFTTLKKTNLIGRDPSIVYYNNKFYISVTNYDSTHDFIIYESEDLINFTTHYINAGLTSYYNRWAPEFFVDDNTLKVIISLQENQNDNFNIYLLECTDIDNLTFGNLTNITPSNETSCIDGQIIKDNSYYYMVVTDQVNTADEIETSRIYRSSDLSNWSIINNDIFKTCYNVEGCQIMKVNNEFIIYGDSPLLNPYLCIETPNLQTTDSIGNNIKDYIQPLYTLSGLRHGCIMLCEDENIQNIIYNLIDEENIIIDYKEVENKINILKVVNTETVDRILIQPNMVIYVTGGASTITKLYNPFRIDKFSIVFYANTSTGALTLTQIQNSEGDTVTTNITYTNSVSLNEHQFNQSLLAGCQKTYLP